MFELTLGMLQNKRVEEQMAAMSLADVKRKTERSSHHTNTGGTLGKKMRVKLWGTNQGQKRSNIICGRTNLSPYSVNSGQALADKWFSKQNSQAEFTVIKHNGQELLGKKTAMKFGVKICSATASKESTMGTKCAHSTISKIPCGKRITAWPSTHFERELVEREHHCSFWRVDSYWSDRQWSWNYPQWR